MSLYVLDTDMLSLLERGNDRVVANVAEHQPTSIAVTVITVEEDLTGWYTLLRRSRGAVEVASAYQRLANAVTRLSGLRILSFTEPAIARYDALRGLHLNIGKMDLRIAAIALEAGAIVVTRNSRDFGRVPGLQFVDWTIPSV